MREYVYKKQSCTSLAELRKLTGIGIGKLTELIDENFSPNAELLVLDKVIDSYLMEGYVYKGEVYKSLRKLAEATGVNRNWLTQTVKELPEKKGRIVLDRLIDDHIKDQDQKRSQVYLYQGRTYHSILEISKDLKHTPATIKKYLDMADNDLEKAMELCERRKAIAVIDGVEYFRREDIANSLGVTVRTLRKYENTEGSIEAAYKLIKNSDQIQKESFKQKKTQKEADFYTYQDKNFDSIDQAAVALKVYPSTLEKYLYTVNNNLEKAMERYEKNTIAVIDNVKFTNQEDVAQHLGVTVKALRTYIASEGSIEAASEAIKKRTHLEISWNGKIFVKRQAFHYKGTDYPSIREAAKALRLYYRTLAKYVANANNDLERAVDRYEKNAIAELGGIKYTNQADVAETLGVCLPVLRNYINAEGSIEAAYEVLRGRTQKEYVWNGETYHAVTPLAKAMKIQVPTLKRLLEQANDDPYLAYQRYQEEKSNRNRRYVMNGQGYRSINALLKDLDLSSDTFRRLLPQYQNDVMKTVYAQMELKDKKREKRIRRQEAEKAAKAKREERNKTKWIYGGKEYSSIYTLSDQLGIAHKTIKELTQNLPKTGGKIELTALIDAYLSKRDQKYQYQGESYSSVEEAAEALGLKRSTLYSYLVKTDHVLEKAMKLYEQNRIVAVIDGVKYTSKIDIAKKLGMSISTLYRYLGKNGSIETAYEALKNQKQYIYKGKSYPSIYKLSKETGVNYNLLTILIRKLPEKEGRIEVDELLDNYYSERNQKYRYKENTYRSIEDAAKALGLSKSTLKKYMADADHDLEKAMALYDKKHVIAVIDSVKYTSKQAIAKRLHVNLKTLAKYVGREGSIEAACEAIINKQSKEQKVQREYIYKDKVYPSINKLSKVTKIDRIYLGRMIKKLPEKEGRIVLDPLLDEYFKRKDWNLQYQGVTYHTAKEAAKALGISYQTIMKHLNNTDHDLQKAMELYGKRHAIAVIDGKEYTNKADIAKSLGVSLPRFNQYLKQEGSIEAAYKAIDNRILKEYIWNGEEYHSLPELAKAAGVGYENLRLHTKLCDNNTQKAIMMIKTKCNTKAIRTKDGRELNITDLAAILGVKQMTLKSYLDRGMTIAQIKERTSGQNINISLRGLKKAQELNGVKADLQELCIAIKINFDRIYNMMTEYGKSSTEAINYYRTKGPEIPRKWIHERYDNLLKHMLSDEKIDYQKVIDIMGKNQMPLREAIEYVVVRDDAIEKSFMPEWQHEIYSAYMDPGLSEEERQECVKAFYITPEEIKAIEECKKIVDRLERKLDLYEIAECMKDQVFTDAEMAEVIKSYKISYQELKTIVTDFYVNLKVGAEKTDKRSKNNIELKSFMAEIIDRYAKLVRHVQDDGKQELKSSKIGEENPDL